MLEQVTTTTQYVFRPLADEERGELYTNEYVKKWRVMNFRATN